MVRGFFLSFHFLSFHTLQFELCHMFPTEDDVIARAPGDTIIGAPPSDFTRGEVDTGIAS